MDVYAADEIPKPVKPEEPIGLKTWPSSRDSTTALLAYLKGPAPDDLVDSAQARATAIDLLAERGAIDAIPLLIACLDDGRALAGSDNWVGGHAGNALHAITGMASTGQVIGYEKEKWQRWWEANKKRFVEMGKTPMPIVR